MEPEAARGLIAHGSLSENGPQVWADLGCGDGTFTRALASLLPDGSTIHAMDRDRSALASIARSHHGVSIETHVGDFTTLPGPFAGLDGVLLANSLHYVREPLQLLERISLSMRRRRVLLVEYDTDGANRWVPYPISKACAIQLFTDAGLGSVVSLGSVASVYRDADIYALLAEAGATVNPRP